MIKCQKKYFHESETQILWCKIKAVPYFKFHFEEILKNKKQTNAWYESWINVNNEESDCESYTKKIY